MTLSGKFSREDFYPCAEACSFFLIHLPIHSSRMLTHHVPWCQGAGQSCYQTSKSAGLLHSIAQQNNDIVSPSSSRCLLWNMTVSLPSGHSCCYAPLHLPIAAQSSQIHRLHQPPPPPVSELHRGDLSLNYKSLCRVQAPKTPPRLYHHIHVFMAAKTVTLFFSEIQYFRNRNKFIGNTRKLAIYIYI